MDYIDYMMLHGVGMDFLDSTAQKFVRYPLIPCNDCKYCMPCPYGIDIPGILSHFNKCINEDLMPVSSQDENYRELRRAFLIGYDRSVPKLRQDNHCVGCDQCIRKCPQRINIPKQMRRIDNNLAENAIRPITLGRKNYLFCGDHEAAVSMSVVCSLLATCKALEVNPREYLNDVIARMPYMQKATYDELLQLLPHKWKKL